MNRRTFLMQTLAVGAFAATSCETRSSSPNQSDKSVVIVGAGVAGLAAARLLRARGVETTILEARSRVGGRIWTERALGNVALDLGAAWIHGIGTNAQGARNPIWTLARELNLRTLPTNYDSLALFKSSGGKLSASEERQLVSANDKLQRGMREAKSRATPQTSLEDAAQEVIRRNAWSGELLEQIYWSLASGHQTAMGANLEEMALLPWEEDEKFGAENGVSDVVFPNGYGELTAALAREVSSSVRLNAVVKRVEQSRQSVVVRFNNEFIRADKALITLPIGVLKSGDVEFSPDLPARKQEAARRLGAGTLNKVALLFPRKFWGDEEYAGLALPASERRRNMEFWNWRAYSNAPILIGLAGGEYARAWETQSREALTADVMRLLRQMYGASIPNPTDILVTKWHSDPFARGSYSFRALGASLADHEILAEDVEQRLFFAGEATSRLYPGTVHGAFLSGERAARSILRSLGLD
jgi:monoamine oxidase